ncbi:conserved hypothetical protein [Xanthomonas citri pv. citri]|nr:conserved hypothetical protein [Xanthomonas citri pv. citri]
MAAIRPMGPLPTIANVLMVLVSYDGSALEHDVAVARVGIAFADGVFERRLAYAEHRFGIDALEVVAGAQRLQLVGGERRLGTEERIHAQKEGEEADRDVHDQGVQFLDPLDRLDDVDVVHARIADDVVNLAVGLAFDALGDAAAEVALVQRLAHEAAIARDREHRRFGHEARQPAQVLGVEPAEHQGRTQHAVAQAAGDHHLFLCALGVGVVVLGHRVHHRGADVHHVRHVCRAAGVEHVRRRGQVVAGEQVGGLAGDLRVQLHDELSAFKRLAPFARLSQIRKDRLHIRMQASQDVEIVRVLIDGYQPGIALSLQFDDQVLPHQPCSAGQDNLVILLCHESNSKADEWSQGASAQCKWLVEPPSVLVCERKRRIFADR